MDNNNGFQLNEIFSRNFNDFIEKCVDDASIAYTRLPEYSDLVQKEREYFRVIVDISAAPIRGIMLKMDETSTAREVMIESTAFRSGMALAFQLMSSGYRSDMTNKLYKEWGGAL